MAKHTQKLTTQAFFNITILLVLHLTTWLPQIHSLPNGAPETVCDTMLPFHGGGILPTSELPPFRIETSTNIIGQGQTMSVEITGVPSGLSFGGFMIQARSRNPPNEIVSSFYFSFCVFSKLKLFI